MAKDYNRGFGIIRHNSPKVAANDLYTYKSKLFCEPSTIFKATTIFIMTSLHILIMATSCLQTKQCGRICIYWICLLEQRRIYLYVCAHVV